MRGLTNINKNSFFAEHETIEVANEPNLNLWMEGESHFDINGMAGQQYRDALHVTQDSNPDARSHL